MSYPRAWSVVIKGLQTAVFCTQIEAEKYATKYGGMVVLMEAKL